MYCKVVFLFCLFIIQPCFYPVVKYCFNAMCFTRFIFVNSVIVSSIISCNDLYQDFNIMYIWYFVSYNSISVLGAIWPSLSPCTVINPILLTYLLRCSWSIACRRCSNYIFIFDLAPGFNGLSKDNCMTRLEAFKFWDLVRLMLEVLR